MTTFKPEMLLLQKTKIKDTSKGLWVSSVPRSCLFKLTNLKFKMQPCQVPCAVLQVYNAYIRCGPAPW